MIINHVFSPHRLARDFCVMKVFSEKHFLCVFVAVKTVITTPLPSQIQATKGLPKTLQCAVQKDPAVTVKWTWTKDGSPVDTARMTVQADGSLRITTVQEMDAGTYTCRVESVAGNAATSGTMRVQGKHIHFNMLVRGGSVADWSRRWTWNPEFSLFYESPYLRILW